MEIKLNKKIDDLNESLEDIKHQNGELKEQNGELKEQINKIHENSEITKCYLYNHMGNIKGAIHSELIIKYPLGYYLFAIDHQKVIIPYDSNFKLNYEFDWNSTYVTILNSGRIGIFLPYIHDNVRNNKMGNFVVGFSRQVGTVNNLFNMSGLRVKAEIISDDEQGIIAVLGFSN